MSISILDLFLYGFLFLFVWISSFLWHELCHIIGMGHLDGSIIICDFGMSAYPAKLWAGGILSGLVFSLAGGIVWGLESHAIGYMFIMCGVVNLVYGCFEAVFLPQWGNNQDYRLGRYSIYVGVTALMLFLWVVFLR